VIVHYLYVFSACFRPTKTDAPLIIDADAVLAGSLAPESFQAIARRHPQIFQASSDLQLPEFSAGYIGDVYKAPDAVASSQCFGVGALERLDHAV
jgi:hypothetical protein